MTMNATPPPCAGVVLLRSTAGGWQCLMVETHQGERGFPKGKRHRGESILQNALRELHEETGIEASSLAFIEGVTADEFSEKGNLAVRYLVATLVGDPPALRVAPDEHRAVLWVPVDEAPRGLRPSRADALRVALAALAAGATAPPAGT